MNVGSTILCDKTLQSFWDKVDASGGSDSCWNWTGGKFWCGYGSFAVQSKTWFVQGVGFCESTKKQWYAHRLSYTISVGQIPEGVQVLHKCDNRACVNPKHLFLGHNSDNVRDKVLKGRQSRGEKHSIAVRASQPRGENAPTSKLTSQQVLEIRSKYKPRTRGFGPVSLAKAYGVSAQSIQGIVNRKFWTHI